ncbi:protein adenylyltransferase SelO [Paenibacillus humicola]|uniref:protein adenylyltransferase SelO n=1 Tax=Paenibacillus humicola TaxID=3110540 RepID=UPI00237BCFB1|nr:YdiU family protein [Paenibacillus humicola]
MTQDQTATQTGWNFDNSYARLPETFFTRQDPVPVSSPKLARFNRSLAAELGLDPEEMESGDGAAVFAGNRIPAGAAPLAQAYAGHQFGYFTMLGDGRAVLLGEQITPAGGRVDIQLKGSGRTPYSRQGDGRAALGPMLREYIISEAVHALHIPTTRSLAVVTTGDKIVRESLQTGAVLTRVAASHLRVGTFQYAAHWAPQDLQTLADYAIERHYPNAAAAENRYLALLQAVIERQAGLIAKWQLAGFIHGVMNTDNMAISGETIDYGPCAFMDAYDPETVFSSIDRQGRYAYGNQPNIGGWNLARFAETLLPLLHENEDKAIELAEDEIRNYHERFHHNWLAGMRAKLGILNAEPEDESLVQDLLAIMQKHGADYTNTFRAFTLGKPEDTPMFGSEGFSQWLELWQSRLGRQREPVTESQQMMRNSNPALIPRNHRVEEALEAAQSGDYSVMERLLSALANPYAYLPEQDEYCSLPAPSARPYRTYCGT